MSSNKKPWVPRPLPVVVRQKQAPSVPWRAWIDRRGGARFWDPSITPFIAYDKPPHAGIKLIWLDAPPIQSLRGTVAYDETDSDDDDDPYGLFSEHDTDDQPSPKASTLMKENDQKSPSNTASSKYAHDTTLTTTEPSPTVLPPPDTTSTSTTTTTSQPTATSTPPLSPPPSPITTKTIRSTNSKVFLRKPSGKLGPTTTTTHNIRRVATSQRLGPEWKDHAWEPPSMAQAQETAHAAVYKAGRAHLWSTSVSTQPTFPLQTRLYFQLLSHLAWTFAILSLLLLPIIITYAQGNRFQHVSTVATLTPSNLGFSERIVKHCSSSSSTQALNLNPLEPPTLSCGSALSNSTHLQLAVFNIDMSMSELSVAVSLVDTLILCLLMISFVLFWVCCVRANVQKEKQTLIQNYAVQVKGLPPNITKAELCKFFSDRFDPNTPGTLYDDGNRIVDDQVVLVNDKMGEEEETATKQDASNLKQELEKERKLKMEMAIKARQRMRNKGRSGAMGYSWRSKRRIIHHDGTIHQKQMFLPVMNTDNTYEPALYANTFVAEVVLAYKGDSTLIQRYRDKQRLLLQLHHHRAVVQMYTMKEGGSNDEVVKSLPLSSSSPSSSSSSASSPLISVSLQKRNKILATAHRNIIETITKITDLKQYVNTEPMIGNDLTTAQSRRPVVCAFVVFQHETSYMRCIEAYHASSTMWCRCCQDRQLRYGDKQHILTVTPAPDPTDLLWENIDDTVVDMAMPTPSTSTTTSPQSTTRPTICSCNNTLLLIMFCLIFSALLSLGVWLLFDRVDQVIASVACAFVFLIGNVVIQHWIAFVAYKEQYTKQSTLDRSTMCKTFAALFFNSGLVIQITFAIMANVNQQTERDNSERWYSQAGVVVLLQMLFNIVSPHIWILLQLVTPTLISCHHRRHILATQEDANQAAFHGRNFALILPLRFAAATNTFTTTLLFSSALPILIPFACLSFAVTYWVDKIMLLRYYRSPATSMAASSSSSRIPLVALFYDIVPLAIVLHFLMAIATFSDMSTFYSERVEDVTYKTTVASVTQWSLLQVWTQKVGRAAALPVAVAFALLFVLYVIRAVLLGVGNGMVRLKFYCINVACGGDDDHHHHFHQVRICLLLVWCCRSLAFSHISHIKYLFIFFLFLFLNISVGKNKLRRQCNTLRIQRTKKRKRTTTIEGTAAVVVRIRVVKFAVFVLFIVVLNRIRLLQNLLR